MDRDFSKCICFTALCFINRCTRDNFDLVTLGHYFDHQLTYCSIVYSHRGFELCRTECLYTKYSLVIVQFLSPSWCHLLLLTTLLLWKPFFISRSLSMLWMVEIYRDIPFGWWRVLALHYELMKDEMVKVKGTKATERPWGSSRT